MNSVRVKIQFQKQNTCFDRIKVDFFHFVEMVYKHGHNFLLMYAILQKFIIFAGYSKQNGTRVIEPLMYDLK